MVNGYEHDCEYGWTMGNHLLIQFKCLNWDRVRALTVRRVHRRVLFASCGQDIYRKDERRMKSSWPTVSLMNYNNWQKNCFLWCFLLINQIIYWTVLSYSTILHPSPFWCINTISHSRPDTTVLLLQLRFLQLQHKNVCFFVITAQVVTRYTNLIYTFHPQLFIIVMRTQQQQPCLYIIILYYII